MPRPHTGYLYQRPGSTMWWIRFRYPAEMNLKTVQKSLGTPDKREAEVLALPLIAEHRRRLYDADQRRKGFIRASEMDTFYPLGAFTREDGAKGFGQYKSVTFEHEGRTWEEENFLTMRPIMRPVAADPDWVPPPPKAKKPVDNDHEHIERWIAHKNVNPYLQKEAKEALRLFKELTGGKLFKDADRDDGRKLVAHLFDKLGNKSATVQKKVGHLCAAVNLAMDEGKLKFNPFSSIIPKRDDAKDREKLFEPEMKLIRDGRDTFDREEWLLYMLCATTGMRRGEAYGIEREYVEDGIRYVIVGTKTDQSLRRVPLPDAVLPLLPRQIHEPLFKKDLKNLGRKTLRQIRRLGVKKDIHGLRHRAKDRLRDGRCPLDIQHHLLGHEEKTVAQGYGTGYPIRELKIEIEKIGY